MPVEYPPLDGPAPQLFDDNATRAAEEALRQLAYADAVIRKCEQCKIPVAEARKDCDGLCEWFTNFLEQQKAQPATVPVS